MAFIKCPECNKEISDTVKTCPNCGHKIKKRYIFSFLNNTMIFGLSILLNFIGSIVGLFLFNKGRYEMFFWIQAKHNLGVEDAMYCIRNIRNYTFMKNIGIVFFIITISLIILMIGYKIYLYKKTKNSK